MVIGDFNEVLHGYEHDGVGSRSQAQMDGFRDALDTCGLSDIGYTGTDWTFEKKVAGGTFTRVRLDRCVANPEWAFSYPSANLEHKATASSDHVALHLRLDGLHACSGSPKPFKYEVCWERDQSLPSVIREGWEKTNGDSLPAVRAKLQGLSADLLHWERTQFSSVRREIASLKNELKILREIPGRTEPSREETKVADRLVELFHREEILWRQRARVEWLAHGDKTLIFSTCEQVVGDGKTK